MPDKMATLKKETKSIFKQLNKQIDTHTCMLASNEKKKKKYITKYQLEEL